MANRFLVLRESAAVKRYRAQVCDLGVLVCANFDHQAVFRLAGGYLPGRGFNLRPSDDIYDQSDIDRRPS